MNPFDRFRRVWPVLFAAALLLPALACVLPAWVHPNTMSSQGMLDITIDYVGVWYRDTFNYSPDAPNIRHFVLVVPGSEADQFRPGSVFTSLDFQSDPVTVRDDRLDYAWTLDYLYEAPQGIFSGEFEPGTYAVAAAFVAGPLSREDAGVGEDAYLWPGVTGGGASTDFQTVTIAAGETVTLTITITDSNGWACPWLYVDNGAGFERRTEILRNLRGVDSAGTEITALGPVAAQDGAIVLRVAEEKDEVTFLDALYLEIDGLPVYAEHAPEVSAVDGQIAILRRGDILDLRFPVPPGYTEGDTVRLVASGYYLPSE